MELRPINRNYNSFKFFYQAFNNAKYEKLIVEEQYSLCKDIFQKHCEEKLHVIGTYIFLFEKIIPFILLSSIIFSLKNPSLIVTIIALIIVNYIFRYFLMKWWNLISQIYSFETTALNDLINRKYFLNIDVDFDELGQIYTSEIKI